MQCSVCYRKLLAIASIFPKPSAREKKPEGMEAFVGLRKLRFLRTLLVNH